jgi:hypothetical protein
MKTIGLLLLFGLCTAIGMHIATEKSARLHRVNGLIRDLQTLSDQITAGQRSLMRISEEESGELFDLLHRYLSLRSDSYSESDAARLAIENHACRTEAEPLCAFLCGLSSASSDAIRQRIDSLRDALRKAQKEADETAKQAKTFRAIGVLIGAGVCILLL